MQKKIHISAPNHLRRLREFSKRAALKLLLESINSAREFGHDIWQFSVDFPMLQKNGLTKSDLHWLLKHGFLQQRINHPVQPTPLLREKIDIDVTSAGLFVLSDDGFELIRLLLNQGNEESVKTEDSKSNSIIPLTAKPSWLLSCRELRLSSLLIKKFSRPAANQMTILAVFEEEGWPSRIDNPLSSSENTDEFDRLHDTIKNLNRRQQNPLIRFRRDGSGHGISWERIS